MKQLFFLFGLSAVSLAAFAQQDQHQHSGNKFGVSVFTNSHTLHPEKRADIGTYAKLSVHFPGWYIATDRWTGGFTELNGKAFSVAGADFESKARALMTKQLAVAGINSADWVLQNQLTNPKGFVMLYFTQKVAGKNVVFAKMNFRFTPDGKIARINMKGYGNPDVSLKASVSTVKALETGIAEMDGAIITTQNIDENWEWFPIPSSKGFELHPAYKFTAEGKMSQNSPIPLNAFGYVDAITGDLLYRDNEVKDADTTNLQVNGNIYKNGALNPTTLSGLPYLTAEIGAATLLANDTGFFASNAFALPTTYKVYLKSKWSEVHSNPDANAVPYFTRTVTALGVTDTFNGPTSFASSPRHVNAYYHVNTVHDFMKGLYPSFTGMDYALVTNVDIPSTVCNAFYTGAGGSSINFFPAIPGSCVSYSEVADVVYHEYGHGIVNKLYGSIKGSGMSNGGLNEGQADIWGIGITGNPVLAEGSSGTPGSFIRRYDLAPKVFPKDLTGEVHDNGEIIAGAWWDYKLNVGNLDSMSKLFSQTLYDVPDGPNGTESEVFHEVLMSALINDDNDADLSTGTPHFHQIVAAFAKHGIYLLQDVDIIHTELAHQPKETLINVSAKLTVSNPVFFKGLNLTYRTKRSAGFVWNTIPMVDAGGLNFSAQIPSQPEGTIVDYYFSAKDQVDTTGVYFPYNYYPVSVLPENKVTLTYQFGVGLTVFEKIDFEGPVGSDWQLGVATDNATTGVWIQAIPVAVTIGGRPSQTGMDHTSGTGQCLVTGNAAPGSTSAYTQSVKNGTTTVLTPFFDISRYTNPVVEYYRWYGNDRGNYAKDENWRVQMSSGSAVIYRDVDYTNQADYQWRRRMFKPLEVYTEVEKMQLKFIARENPAISSTGSRVNGLVEAAVDDIVIYEGKEGITSVKETAKQLASIYPNPAQNQLNILLPSGNFNELSISFFDLTGKEISTVPTTHGASRYSVDTHNMIPGQYFVVIKMDQTIQTHKVTIVAE